jgi:ribosome modulation factor
METAIATTNEKTARRQRNPKAPKPAGITRREERLAQRAERMIAREAAAAAKLAARIALVDDPKLKARAFAKGYQARLADVAADANPFDGRIATFATEWTRGWHAADADLQR